MRKSALRRTPERQTVRATPHCGGQGSIGSAWGCKSFDDRLLHALGRIHTASEAIGSFEAARQAGFENINIDLMFALPGQTMQQWQRTLRVAISLQPEHISCYSLTIEPNTPFYTLQRRGQLNVPDEETDLRMYLYAIRVLTRAGYEHYEISNFAKPGYRCRHNIVYWLNEEYLGFGPGAVSYSAGCALEMSEQPAPLYTGGTGWASTGRGGGTSGCLCLSGRDHHADASPA
jgi:coproporphyrinogen III oxidase-like Fe-S oxidoreductase